MNRVQQFFDSYDHFIPDANKVFLLGSVKMYFCPQTLLHQAVEGDNPRMADKMWTMITYFVDESGMSIHVKDCQCNTMLHTLVKRSCRNETFQVFERLVAECGARLNALNNAKYTPVGYLFVNAIEIDCKCFFGSPHLRLAFENYPDTTTLATLGLDTAVEAGHLEVAEWFLTHQQGLRKNLAGID